MGVGEIIGEDEGVGEEIVAAGKSENEQYIE
jgi:hypothetical protein